MTRKERKKPARRAYRCATKDVRRDVPNSGMKRPYVARWGDGSVASNFKLCEQGEIVID